MRFSTAATKTRIIAVSLGSLLALAAATTAPSQVDASSTRLNFAKHTPVLSGLDNPRQLSVAPNGDLLVAEAGHGSYNPKHCKGSGQNAMCAGASGSVIQVGKRGVVTTVMRHLLSLAGPDGTFAVGSDGVGKRVHGPYYSIITYGGPASGLPRGSHRHETGRLVATAKPGGTVHNVANITAYERRHDPDGEGFDSDPYSVLALRHQTLVADAAGDDILSVRGHKVSLWALMPEYGKKLDFVPTVLTKGPHGTVYVGELHSEVKNAAKVWQYDRHGKAIRSWRGFTTVTGIAHGRDGSLYVSELEGGACTFDQIPTCFPGRVVRIRPDGHRSYRRVPLPAGVAVTHGKVYVAAFSIAPAKGALGNPDWNGQIWRIFI